MAAILYII